MDMMATERVCYVHCNFCNTILAVNVPYNSLLTMVTVRCGHCANLLSVNMAAASLQPFPPQLPPQKQHLILEEPSMEELQGSSSKSNKIAAFEAVELEQPRIPLPPIRPTEKRHRVPSAYNRFIKMTGEKRYGCVRSDDDGAWWWCTCKHSNAQVSACKREEIQRIKASNPDISHREAFSSAAKNWAHFPHIHFGKQAKLDHEEGTEKSNGFY